MLLFLEGPRMLFLGVPSMDAILSRKSLDGCCYLFAESKQSTKIWADGWRVKQSM